MALTPKKKKFVEAINSGMTKAKAAIHAGYSEKTAAQMATKLMKDKDVLCAIERKEVVNQAKEKAKTQGKTIDLPDLSKMYSDPKDFLLAVMNDASEELKIRVEAAKVVMPYLHGKIGESGKKQNKQDAAVNSQNNGKFAGILKMAKH